MTRAWTHAVGVMTALALLATPAHGTTYSAAGPDPAAIRPTVEAFQADLGSARRQITWDDVPDSQADPNLLRWDAMEGQGIWFSDPGFRQFLVSASAASGRAPEFGWYHPSYPAELQPYSGERLFTREDAGVFDLNFVVPGTGKSAAVRGFGIVFADVDTAGSATVKLIGLDGGVLDTLVAQPSDKGLSFVGATYPAASIARVSVTQGGRVTSRHDEALGGDVIAMDDFLLSEPEPAPGYFQLRSDTLRISEGPNLFHDHVTRTGNLQFGASYSVEAIGGTAKLGVDYSISPSSSYFPAGDAGRNSPAIYSLQDTAFEGDETAIVRVVPDRHSEAGTPSVATFVIADDDPAPAAPPLRDLAAPRFGSLAAVSGRRPALRFRLTEAATVAATLARVLPGRRVGRRCVAPSRGLRARPACTRAVRLPGVLRRAGKAGANRVAVPARVGGRRLVPARYRAALLAVDPAGNRSRPASVGFTLTR